MKQIVYKNLTELKPYEKNPRNNKNAVDAVANSIKEFGFQVPIVIDKDNVIVAGHTRYKASKKLKLKEVPCIIADELTDEQIKAFRLADNKTGELAEWDFDLLMPELEEILDFNMEDFGFDLVSDKDDEWDFESMQKEFEKRMQAGEDLQDSEEYQEFLKKFEAKKTTDDCYTPPNIYEVVKDWCVEKYHLEGRPIIRPFYPNGDYQKEKYPANCVVIDNPPFSIMTEIVQFYLQHNIDFFMFGPGLTLFHNEPRENYVITYFNITYENGANVCTSFLTNMGDKKITVSSELYQKMKIENDKNLSKIKKSVPKYTYPAEITTAARLGYLAQHGQDFEIDAKDVYFIRALESQKDSGSSLYGSGFLLSEQAASEQAAREQAAREQAAREQAARVVWSLSEKEKEIVRNLGN